MEKSSDQLQKLKNSEVSFGDIILLIVKRVKFIIYFTSLVFLITFIYLIFFSKPIFTSTSKIMSSNASTSEFGSAGGLAAQFGINLSQNQKEPKWSYEEIIKSRTLAKSVLKKNFTSAQFGINKPLMEIILTINNLSGNDRRVLEHYSVNYFIDNMVEVKEDVKNNIFILKTHSPDPNLSSSINSAIINELDLHRKQYNKSKTNEAKKFIESRIVSTEKELMEAEETLKVFRDRNRRIQNSPALQLQQERLTREVAVLTGVFTTLKQQLETTKIEEYKDSDYVIIFDPPEVPIKRSKPKRFRILFLSIIISIGMGVVFSLLMDYFSDEKELRKLKNARSILFHTISSIFKFSNYK